MPATTSPDRIEIRAAAPGDADALASLSTELGYPSTAEAAGRRMAAFADAGTHAVYVAEQAGRVLAWVQVSRVCTVESDAFAEITGLVVTAAARGAGIGGMLVAACEDWARRRGLARIRVRSRVARTDAHRFYERLGFEKRKEQVVFDKTLAKEDRSP